MAGLENISVERVKGVGDARKKLLARLAINTVADALHFYPRDYSDRRQATPIRQIADGSSALVLGTVASVSLRRLSWRNSILTVKVSDGTADLNATWFNQPYLRNRFRGGARIVLFGKIGHDPSGKPQMTSPEVEILDEGESPSPHFFGIVPIYSTTENLSQHVIRSILHRVVEEFCGGSREFLPFAIRERFDLPSLPEALRTVHFPESWSLLEQARKRLAFEEFFLLQMGAAIRKKIVNGTAKQRPELESQSGNRADRFLSCLPFPLTAAQKRSVEEIRSDLSSPRPMNRLLHGDVGCGKTIVAVWLICAQLTAAARRASWRRRNSSPDSITRK